MIWVRYSGFEHLIPDAPTDLCKIFEEIAHVNVYSDGADNNFRRAPSPDDFTLVDPAIMLFKDTVDAVFFQFFQTYKDTCDKREHERQVAAWVDNNINEHATKEMADALEEINMSSPKMAELIDSCLQQAMKQLENRITTKLDIVAKNGQVAPRNSGSRNNKNKNNRRSQATKNPPKTSNNSSGSLSSSSNKAGQRSNARNNRKATGRKADGDNNDSNDGRNRSRNRNGGRHRNTN